MMALDMVDLTTHHFNVAIATKLGLESAILLSGIHSWVFHNKANDAFIRDGKAWAYNSVKAWQELYPYMTIKTIRSALIKLKNEGLIEIACFNKSSFNNTKWYTLTDKGWDLFGGYGRLTIQEPSKPTEQSEQPKQPKQPGPLPVQSKPKYTKFVKPSVEDVKQYIIDKGYHVDAETFVAFYESKGWKVGKSPMVSWRSALRTWDINERKNESKIANDPVYKTMVYQQDDYIELNGLPF